MTTTVVDEDDSDDDEPDDTIITLLLITIVPLCLANVLLCSVYPTYVLFVGIPIVLMPKFEIGTLLHVIQRYRVTTAPLVPTIILTLNFSMEDKGLAHFAALGAVLQWWFFNVLVIIMKLDFQFPLTVSLVHFICSAIGVYTAIRILKLKELIDVDSVDRWWQIFPMSFVFFFNIVLGNSLIWGKSFDRRIWMSLMPVVGGIMLTSITEMSFNMLGFLAVFFGCLVTWTNTILAEFLLHGYNFDSINTIYHMAPYATMILAFPVIILEGSGVMTWVAIQNSLLKHCNIIFGSGMFAFCLNFSIFYVIKTTTIVTFNVAGNMKVAVAIIVSWLIFCNPTLLDSSQVLLPPPQTLFQSLQQAS